MHTPVMAEEALDLLDLGPGDFVVDGTLGFGGHALRFLERVGPEGLVLGIEKNPQTLREAAPHLAARGIRVVAGDFADIRHILEDGMFPEPAGVFLDLGLSSFLLEGSGLGFSFKRPEEILDMRFDPEKGLPAYELINAMDEEGLRLVIREYGEEPLAGKIAESIAGAKPLKYAGDLAGAVEACVSRPKRAKALARVFQGFRILVNDELGTLVRGLAGALSALRVGGRFAVISYHSLEDRVVKAACRLEAVEALTKKPKRPSRDEIERNLRSRSARLRAGIKKGDVDEEIVADILGGFCPVVPFGLG